MYSGYIQKQYDTSSSFHHSSASQTSSSSSSSSSSSHIVHRVYCILWGTMLLDYHSQDEAMNNLAPIYSSEIIGISKLEENNIHGFLIVTLSGITHRVITKTSEEAMEWMINIRVGLECVFGNKEILEHRPSKKTYDFPSCQNNSICPLTSQMINPTSSSNQTCKSCGYVFSTPNQFASCPVLHFIKSDEPLMLCPYCYQAQLLLISIKQSNYVTLHSLHEYSPEILLNPDGVYQATSILRQWTYPSLSKLTELKNISSHDISTLQQIEMKYQFNVFMAEYEQMRVALHTLGTNLQYIVDFLRNPILKYTFNQSSPTGVQNTSRPTWMHQFALYKNYELVILRLLELSAEDSDMVDYYWFQLLSIYLHLSKSLVNRYISIYILSLYQQCLLSIALQYPVLGMRMVWYFLATLEDYKSKKINQYQYASTLSLLLQFETYTYGGPECLLSHHSFPATSNPETPLSPFQSLLYPSRIQKLELWKELQTLLNTRQLIRRTNRYKDLVQLISPESEVNDTSMSLSDPGDETQPITCLAIYLGGFSQILLSKPSIPPSPSIHDAECLLTITSADWYVIKSFGNDSFHKDQFQFMSKLFALIDSLRFIDDYRQREAMFIHELDQGFLTPENEVKDIGYDPTTIASEPLYQLKYIYLDECKIYRTKARTPTRIVFGVVIDPSELIKNGANIASHPDVETGSNSSNDVTIFHPHHHQHNLINGEENVNIPIQQTREGKMISEVKSQIAAKLNKTLTEMKYHMTESRVQTTTQDSQRDSINMENNLVSPSNISRRASGSKFLSSLGSSESNDVSELPTQTPNAGQDAAPSSLTNQNESDTVILSPEYLASLSVPRNVVEEVYGVRWSEKKKDLISKYLQKRSRPSAIESSDLQSPVSDDLSPLHYQEPLNLHHPKYFSIQEDHDADRTKPLTGSLSVWPYYDIRSYIFKTNDDLRQEIICMQLIEFCQEVFLTSHVNHLLWLKPYRIVSTGASSGLVETLPNTLSLDAIKKSPNFISLAKYFENLYAAPVVSSSDEPSSSAQTLQSSISLHQAKLNFVASLAAYSLICYVFQIKDRHNGNILLDSEGHIIHIDYGFILGIAPGGSYFSIETAPFKLTEDYIELLDGLNSPYFTSFIQSFTLGFLILQSKLSNLITMIDIFRYNESIPCFHAAPSTSGNSTGKDDEIIAKLKFRLQNGLSIPQTIDYCLELIISSYSHLGTINYDNFQWYTNGIQP